MDNNPTNPINLIRSLGGRFASVTYRKKDGTVQRYTVRTGVKKFLMGGTKHHIPDSITVFSVTGSGGYKTFLQEGILTVKSGNRSYVK
jgi:hypothetical protein